MINVSRANGGDLAGHLLALQQFALNRSLNNFRYHGNPIFEQGKPGEWDDTLVRDPMIFVDEAAPEEERFKLYYCGMGTGTGGHMQIGLAYGSSLESLTRYPGNPIVTMTEEWENDGIDPAGDDNPGGQNHTPYVFQIPGSHTYEMLYTGRGREQDGRDFFSTMRVTSIDGKTWGNKKRVLGRFDLAGHTYSPTKPIPIYNAEEGKYFLICSVSLLQKTHGKNEGFVALATSDNGEEYSFEQVIVPQDQAFAIYDSHGLVPMLGWYFLLITHDSARAFDMEGNEGYPERWMVSRDLRTWYADTRSVWDTYPDDGYLYSHVSPLLTEAGMGYVVYDYGKPNVFGLAKIPLIGRPYNTVLEKTSLASGESTRIADCYPAISLEPGQNMTLTVECTYDVSATAGLCTHVFTSYDGQSWDTEEQQDTIGDPVFAPLPLRPGNTVRQTRDIDLGARFVKVTVENPDPHWPVTDLKVVVTL
jgi:hypothetical protein